MYILVIQNIQFILYIIIYNRYVYYITNTLPKDMTHLSICTFYKFHINNYNHFIIHYLFIFFFFI